MSDVWNGEVASLELGLNTACTEMLEFGETGVVPLREQQVLHGRTQAVPTETF